MFIARLSERLSGEKPQPKPYYYHRMNPEELAIWEIIGEQEHEWSRDRKGKLRKRRLSYKDRAARQRMFYDSRVGHGVCGDDWMRKELPKRAP
ncbi:hypothetical protein FB567DRAFT_208439 [Paraphoma chrysanthemicola]|uniref:Uncharacterized protein n=1 Tax=Paraphoma chrysanthemicola TaxID=798071 RepID=A0A8K0VTF8_9PLEO|nr:hypothetical protein FB567DRAFT_208439 [Paraphoma chrysanthemicola]